MLSRKRLLAYLDRKHPGSRLKIKRRGQGATGYFLARAYLPTPEGWLIVESGASGSLRGCFSDIRESLRNA